MTLSIVTVSHNSGRHLPRYVETFLASGSGRTTEIEFILVENSGRPDAEAAMEPLRRAGFTVTFLQVENHGFGHGCNAGAALARGGTLIFVNPDVEFIDAIDPIAAAGNGRLWGSIAQVNESHEVCAFDALPEHKTVLGELRRRYGRLDPNQPGWRDRVYPVGAFFIVDRSLFEKAGGFDERFFMYFEEAELSRRLHRLGGAPAFFPDIRLLHSAFGSEDSKASTWRHEARGLLTYARITGRSRVVLVRAATLVMSGLVSSAARRRLSALAGAALARNVKSR